MKLLLSDNNAHLKFAPLTLTRPIGSLRCGLFTNEERWLKWLPEAQIGFETEAFLQDKFPKIDGIKVAAQIIPNEEFAMAVLHLPQNSGLFYQGELLAQHGTPLEKIAYTGQNPVLIAERWDLFQMNDAILRADFELSTAGRKSEKLAQTNTLIGPADQLFIEEGAQIEGAILNTNHGPIYIGRNAEIMEGAMLRGPLAVLDGAVIKMGAKIYGATTIGPECRIGGEVSNSIFYGYSNKGHDGFIGNALIGEWCNLGADTNCSNLKNNYGLINTYSYETQSQIKTPLQFMGVCMGDHSKTAINVQLNTATVIGVCANIFSSGFPDKFIPSFSWVGDDSTEAFQLSKAIEAAKAMMSRRKIEFTAADLKIFETIYK
jgi:UDP-N-acetylglucosamine diphosphorylase/glucosamine-1-phosphate N-acetyltransferase